MSECMETPPACLVYFQEPSRNADTKRSTRIHTDMPTRVLTHVQALERSLVMLSFSFDLGSTSRPPPPCIVGVYGRSYMFHQPEQIFHWTGLSKSLYWGERDRHDGE
jgi:hypothetical protein